MTSARGAATRRRDRRLPAAEHAGDRGAVFCRLEHVVPWAIQGAHWEPASRSSRRARTGADCAHCGAALEEATCCWSATAASTGSRTASARSTTCRVGEGGRTVAHPGTRRRLLRLVRPVTLGSARYGQVRNRRRLSALGHGRAGRQQERRAADPRGVAPHRGGARDRQRAAHPRRRRRCSALLEDLGVSVTWRDEHELALRADSIRQHRGRRRARRAASGPRSCSRGRCWRASARRTCRRPGGDFIGRRRLDPHLDALRRARRADRGRPRLRDVGAGRPARVRLLHGRGERDGDREHPDGGRAHAGHDDDPQRRLRAARAGPRAPAGRDGRARSTASARTCSPCTAASASAARAT